jgi:DNA processing protein
MLHISTNHKDFPPQLLTIASPPRELFILSDNWQELLGKPMLTVVGSRHISPYGRAVIDTIVRKVAASGVTIVSGLALGTDSVAHQAALDGGGTTIAVLPCGLDTIYPSSHRQLAADILKQGGAIISEYPPKTIPFKPNFIARNRIVSGLGRGVLITEAAPKSGTLHTASFALEQGKEVMAVPGPITSPTSAGCNQLIRTGATPITCAEDVFEALKLRINAAPEHTFTAKNPAEYVILTLIQKGIHDGEHIYKQSKLDFSTYQQTLSMLEITGCIKSTGGDTWALK